MKGTNPPKALVVTLLRARMTSPQPEVARTTTQVGPMVVETLSRVEVPVARVPNVLKVRRPHEYEVEGRPLLSLKVPGRAGFSRGSAPNIRFLK
jgi:hypothetical protein